ncbi:alpha/beta fold hydrolase [Streptomonospora litoralis]|uniref:3-oxoadipate enol-lactonase 2 n=1 Tax=Streptomonospora litoralis TaxID=2498135 RepID=A0A4P6Q9I2_9ACTN|nr:alpha/beta hydrolase [Streptomonospora litoralis]QBI55737.1 3-oxoadipate enol-lactonase 2 [Streptomonospora litoralis]
MQSPTPEELRIPVSGGDLAALRWPAAGGDGAGAATGASGTPPVLAVHGITANGLSFGAVAAHLAPHTAVVAPDLRGRGASGHLPGPYGLGAHVDDLVAVLDHLGVERAVLAGHSMGAFVSCLAAVRRPDRFAAALLVDGGYGLAAPPGTDIEAVIGPAMARLRMEFADRDAYRGFWRRHPAFGGELPEVVDAYIQRDLVGAEPHMHSPCVEEAVRTDGAQVLADAEVLGAVHRLPCPTRLLWARRGLLDEEPGLYTPETLTSLAEAGVPTEEVPGTNHYSLLFDPESARLVAERVRDLQRQSAGA